MKVLFICMSLLTIILCSCNQKEEKTTRNLDEITKSPIFSLIELDSNCIYIVHNGGLMGTETVIQINPTKSENNTTLLEYDSYTRNSNSLKIIKSYVCQIKIVDEPNFSKLKVRDLGLVLEYKKSDKIWSYFDYSIYLPKEDKTYWINPYDGIDSTERESLNWIQKYVSKISIKEAVNYYAFEETKKSLDKIDKELFNDSYIIPNKELTGLPKYINN